MSNIRNQKKSVCSCSHGTHVDESWHTHGWVTAHAWKRKERMFVLRVLAIRMGHGTHVSESLHTHEWVLAHTCMTYSRRMNNTLQAHCKHTANTPQHNATLCNTLHTWCKVVRHDSVMHVTWRFHVYDMTHSCVWHDSLAYEWLCHVSRYVL